MAATVMMDHPLSQETDKITVTLADVMNDKFAPLMWDRHRFLVFCGGASAGKSKFIAQKMVIRNVERRGEKFLALRKIGVTCKRSVFSEIRWALRTLNLDHLYQENKSDYSFRHKLWPENEIICAGLDDAEKLKSIEGITSIWIEEATEFTREEIIQINLRMRGKVPSYKQICLSFNPISEHHHIKKDFFDENYFGARTIHSTYRDNRFLTPEDAEQLENLKRLDANLHKIYALGLWGSLTGLVYKGEWGLREMPDDLDPALMMYGLDFGYNHAMALVGTCFVDDGVILDQAAYAREWTTGDLIAHMDGSISKASLIIADSAEPDRIEELCRAGYKVRPASKGAGSVMAGINKVKSQKIYTTRRSEDIRKEKQAYKWQVDRNGESLDVPVKAFDDLMDAARYVIQDHFTHNTFSFST